MRKDLARSFRKDINKLEKFMSKQPDVQHNDCFPLKHIFGDNIYIREITMPPGQLITSKIHKFTHPYFVMKGKVSVVTEDGVIHIQAPYWGVTKAGTKRVLYIHEETVWITVHSNPKDEKDTCKIENYIVAKSFKDLNKFKRLRGK